MIRVKARGSRAPARRAMPVALTASTAGLWSVMLAASVFAAPPTVPRSAAAIAPRLAARTAAVRAAAAARSVQPADGVGTARPAAPLIAAGGAYSCRIQRGRAYCWGSNDYGQLGNGSVTSSSIPVPVATGGVLAGKTLTQVSTGAAHTCALDSAGAAYCWGYGGNGGLGNGTTVFSSDVPVAVSMSGALAGKALVQVVAGYDHTCALAARGAAYCWGDNSRGELGDGTTVGSSVPVPVSTGGVLAGKAMAQVTVGFFETCALGTAGAAYCWGAGLDGALGNGSTADSAVPVAVHTRGVLAGRKLTRISTGYSYACALDRAGQAYCWGYNVYGQLGNGRTADSSVPVRVVTRGARAGRRLTQISAGDVHACALGPAGQAYCWGSNYQGALGSGSTVGFSAVPVRVDLRGPRAGRRLTQIAAGDVHSCALDASGAAYCWGQNYAGQLGNDSTAARSRPVLAGPHPPTRVRARPGRGTATVSWTAPASLAGATLTGYTATAWPGGRTCATKHATTCTIKGLANGTAYRVTVLARTTAGDSGASTPATVIPRHAHWPGR